VLEREDSPLWYRGYSTRDDAETCALLTRSLETARVRRLVVGHTVQDRGVTAACDGRVWRIDVGLARHYGGPTQVLELTGETARVLGASATSSVRPGAGSSVGEEAVSSGAGAGAGATTHEAHGHDCASEHPSRDARGLWQGSVLLPTG